MPIVPVKYRIKDYNALSIATDLLDKIIEVESASGVDKNYKVSFPLLVQGINNALPAPLKTTHIIARTYDTTTPGYIAGDETFLSIVANRPLVNQMTARVEFPRPTTDYRLVYDANGSYQAYRDSTFTGSKIPAAWVIIGSADDIASGIDYFNPFQAKYLKTNTVKFNLNGTVRIFEAKQDLVKSTFSGNQQPAPTGLATDVNWTEINSELAPNYSRLGQLACRFYTNAERGQNGGDTVEDLIARENAGAGILYTNRTVTVELGANAGTYRVEYDATNPEFTAWVDGSFTVGRNPCSFTKVLTGGSGSGSIVLTGITESVGGFKLGDSFTGTDQEFATRLLIKYQNPVFNGFNFNGMSSQNVLAGTSYAGGFYRFDWSTTNPTNVATNSITLVDTTAGTTLVSNTQNDGTEQINLPAFTIYLGDNKHFIISAQDTKNGGLAADITLTGVLARIYGASNLTPAQLKSTLAGSAAFSAGSVGLQQDLSTSLANNITADCSGGKYIYYLYDAQFPDPTTVRSGLNPFSAYQVERITFNDALGNPRDYKILYTNTIQYGSAVNVNVVS